MMRLKGCCATKERLSLVLDSAPPSAGVCCHFASDMCRRTPTQRPPRVFVHMVGSAERPRHPERRAAVATDGWVLNICVEALFFSAHISDDSAKHSISQECVRAREDEPLVSTVREPTEASRLPARHLVSSLTERWCQQNRLAARPRVTMCSYKSGLWSTNGWSVSCESLPYSSPVQTGSFLTSEATT